MGIMVPIARAILKEHRFKPITGSILLIGRQTVPLTIEEAKSLLVQEGVPLRADFNPNAPGMTDTGTRFGKDKHFVSDIGFFAMFSDAKIRTLDVTDYENAEIIHDMHVPIPDELAETMDFIYNGSCLDNMFDPAMAIKSTTRMLKPGGRMFCMEIGTPHYLPYVMYSHSWFFDYCAINSFGDCKVYTCIFHPNDIWNGPYDIFVATTFEGASNVFPHRYMQMLRQNKAVLTVTIGEKGPDTTWERTPIQWQYRPDHTPFRVAYAHFNSTPRPLMKMKRGFFGYPLLEKMSAVRYIGTLRGVPGPSRFPRKFAHRISDAFLSPGWTLARIADRILGR